MIPGGVAALNHRLQAWIPPGSFGWAFDDPVVSLRSTTGYRLGSRWDQNAKSVRQTLIDRGIRPESLLPDEDVKKVERRLISDEKKAHKKPDSLGDSNLK